MSIDSKVFYFVFLFSFFFFFFFLSFASSSSLNRKVTHKCPAQQTLDLLLFKQNLSSINYPLNDYTSEYCYDWLGSSYYPIMMNNWNASTDCCDWNGVTCDDFTGDVIGLDLSCGMIQGTIHPNTSLFNLPRLQRLNLSYNNFTDSKLPRGIGRFSNSLTHLNISRCGFSGQVPSDITRLHKLVSLDLSSNYDHDLSLEPHVFNTLLKNATLLRHLSLAYVNISSFLPAYLNLSYSLESLDLRYTNLRGKLPHNIFNLRYLEKLDLSGNYDLTGPLPNVNTSTNIPLKELDLSGCSLVGSIPKSIVNLRQLTYIDLSYNYKLNGTLPSGLFTLPLKELYLGGNQFDGQIDQGSVLQTYRQLIGLDLSFNNFRGEWELDTLLSTLTNLEFLDLSYSGLSLTTNNANHYANPDFQYLMLASCKLKVFLESLRAMRNLIILDLSSNDIHGSIPLWAGEIGGNELIYLNLSHNFITGMPQFQWYGLEELYLQSNMIQGPFHPSICNLGVLSYLDMSNNKFEGVIPQCFVNITSSVVMVNLGNNSFHGTIPNAFEKCRRLEGLILNGNELDGEVPTSISNCQSLKVVDLGNNHLNGTFPHWLGSLSELQVLVLKSNRLHGSTEASSMVKFPFQNLQVLDLSNNNFTGHLPKKYFQNFNAMKNVANKGTKLDYLRTGSLYYSIVVNVKGSELEIPKIFVNFKIVDLSNNKFEGEIPDIIGNLTSLIVLDLSNNRLTGRIPDALGKLSEIESLDLSWNQLTGKIPQSLAGLTFLAFLNLSQNHLVGRIPQGTQFSTFEADSFEGNPGLCGLQLPKKCEHQSSPPVEADEDDDDDGFTWKMVMMGYGIGTVIGIVLGYFMLSTGKPKWFNAIADEIEHMIFKRTNKR